MTTEIVLGPEYDNALHQTVLAVLSEMGAELEPMTWAVAGSQEVATRYAMLEGKRLKLESETYIGLSLSGDGNAIEAVARRVRDRMAASGQNVGEA